VLITANALDMRISAGMLAQAVSAVQVLACACGGVTFLAGAATGKRGTAIAAGAGFAVISYFIDSLAEITSAVRPWRAVSVFHQASPISALGGDFGITGVLATAAVAVACFLAAVYLFQHRDLAA
jgi:ABC-2 type transport system permease protein